MLSASSPMVLPWKHLRPPPVLYIPHRDEDAGLTHKVKIAGLFKNKYDFDTELHAHVLGLPVDPVSLLEIVHALQYALLRLQHVKPKLKVTRLLVHLRRKPVSVFSVTSTAP